MKLLLLQSINRFFLEYIDDSRARNYCGRYDVGMFNINVFKKKISLTV